MNAHFCRCLVRLTGIGSFALGVACGRSRQHGSEKVALASDSSKQAATVDSTTALLASPGAAVAVKPHIDALVPDTVRVPQNSVPELVIRGSGFEPGAPGRNTVMIGPIRLTQVPANSAATEIRIVIPDRIVSQSEAPPRPVLPGTYPVTVETSAGTSNAVNVRILP